MIGDTESRLMVRALSETGATLFEGETVLTGTSQNQPLPFDFGASQWVKSLYLEVHDLHQGEPGNVHIWEIQFKE